jgi:uncharacterized protein (TIGR02118 family)
MASFPATQTTARWRSGERETRMTKVVYVMFKKEAMGREVQNHALADPEGNEPPYDGFEEFYFESQEAMEEAIASSEGQATINDLPNFCNTAKTLGIIVEEVE